jgi:putative tricarboxylic transport membrane protein
MFNQAKEEMIMKQTRKLSCSVLLIGAVILSGAMTSSVGAAEWQPTKPVEVIVPAGAGGASDQMARTIQGIIIKHQLMKQP